MNEPVCGHHDALLAAPDVLDRLGLSFPETHRDGAAMARLARGVKENKGAALCLLPFCCTVEAEALGAAINLGDAAIGPRGGAFTCFSLRDVLNLPPLDLTTGRIAQVLAAGATLARQGEAVALEISGPLTILNWLMDLASVYKEWRKDEGLMVAVLDRLRETLCHYAREAGKRGVAFVSYADPTGSLSMLGPKRFTLVAEKFLLPLLRDLDGDSNFGASLHLCPKIAQALVCEDRAVWRELPVASPVPYDAACLLVKGKKRFLGETCLKNTGYSLRNGVIKSLVPV